MSGRGVEAGMDGAEQATAGIRRWLRDEKRTLLPNNYPQGQQPTCAACFLRLFTENMKVKVYHINRRSKNPSHINLGMPSLGFIPPTPRPQEVGSETNFISSTYRGQEIH